MPRAKTRQAASAAPEEDVPDEELRRLAAALPAREAVLAGGTWRRARYRRPDDAPPGPVAVAGVWSDANGATSPNDPDALLIALVDHAAPRGDALADLVIMARSYLPRLVREVVRRRDRELASRLVPGLADLEARVAAAEARRDAGG